MSAPFSAGLAASGSAASPAGGASGSSSGGAPSLSTGVSSSGVRVGIVGCGHGELDAIYSCVRALEARDGVALDLLLVCGDFQSVRNWTDLKCMACPEKYRRLNTFYKYYAGEAVAPVLTIFIGGNHEASNYLVELFHGGWVAPNIYYMGFASVLSFGGLRLGGLSGIWNEAHARIGHYERSPFNSGSERSVYHVREFDLWRLMQMRDEGLPAAAASASSATPAAAAAAASPNSLAPAAAPLDIFMSHDWPRHIAKHGDTQGLLRRKPFLASEIADGSLGSPPAEALLHALKPRYWFSAHMHVKFAAVVRHGAQAAAGAGGNAAPAAQPVTRFLALDKCLPHRDYMQLLEFPEARGPKVLCYDAHWLAVLRKTHHLISLRRQGPNIPAQHDYRPTRAEIEWIHARLAARRIEAAGLAPVDPSRPLLAVPLNFARTAPAWVPSMGGAREAPPPVPFSIDPQTKALLELLELPDIFTAEWGSGGVGGGNGMGAGGRPYVPRPFLNNPAAAAQQQSPLAAPSYKKQRTGDAEGSGCAHNPDEIALDDEDATGAAASAPHNPDEIALDDVDAEEPDDEGRRQGPTDAAPAAAEANPDEIDIDNL